MGSPTGETDVASIFWNDLAQLGWTEGRNLTRVHAWAEGDIKRLPTLAAQLLDQKVDLIITGGTPGALAVKQTGSSVPVILVAYDRDPVAAGVVESLSHPGGNITGIFSRQIDLVGKRLELLKETLPAASRVSVLYDRARPPQRADLETAARKLELQLHFVEIESMTKLSQAVRTAKASGDAALVLYSPALYEHRAALASAATRARLPTVCQERAFVAAGALLSFAPDRDEVLKRVADYADRILRGAKPADLPFEEAARFKLAVNATTARRLKVQIPESILVRADEIIR